MAAEEVNSEGVPMNEDTVTTPAPTELPSQIEPEQVSPTGPEPRRSDRAVKTPAWHQDYLIVANTFNQDRIAWTLLKRERCDNLCTCVFVPCLLHS